MENIVDEPGPVYKKAFEGYEYRVQKNTSMPLNVEIVYMHGLNGISKRIETSLYTKSKR